MPTIDSVRCSRMRLPPDLRTDLERAYREGYGREISPDEADALGTELLEMFGRALLAICVRPLPIQESGSPAWRGDDGEPRRGGLRAV